MREVRFVGRPELHRLPDGRWEAVIEALGLRGVGACERDARSAVRALVVPKLNSLSPTERDAYVASLPIRYANEECRIDGTLGTIYDAEGNEIVASPKLRVI